MSTYTVQGNYGLGEPRYVPQYSQIFTPYVQANVERKTDICYHQNQVNFSVHKNMTINTYHDFSDW